MYVCNGDTRKRKIIGPLASSLRHLWPFASPCGKKSNFKSEYHIPLILPTNVLTA